MVVSNCGALNNRLEYAHELMSMGIKVRLGCEMPSLPAVNEH